MSAPPKSRGEPIAGKHQLVEYIEQGNKPPAQWRIGTEHEKFGFDLETLRRMPYEGPKGIGALLRGLQRFGWEPVEEDGNVIALTCGACNITLEPGGQFELSGAPVETIHQTCDEVQTHLKQVKEVGNELGIGMLGMGFDPKSTRDEVPWMPKGRYKIMRDQMMRRGKLGLDMMLRTCTVQVNLDFESEADMVRKLRVSLALQPLATALFADSPFTEGKPNGYQSYRAHIWTDTDPDRTGMLPFAFEPGMGFERYVDYMLDVPMYFVYRDGHYLDTTGQSFRDFMVGKLPALPGEIPSMGDWVNHMTTAFPEVRLKRFLEMRGADGGPWDRLCALPALLGRAALRQPGAGCRLRSGEGLDGGGAGGAAPRGAAPGAGCRLPRPQAPRLVARCAPHRPRRADPPAQARPHGRRREPFPQRPRPHRRFRQDPGAGEARALPRPVEGLGRSGLRGVRLLGPRTLFRHPGVIPGLDPGISLG